MTDALARLRELGRAVEEAVQSGDGRAVVRRMDRWSACFQDLRRAGDSPGSTVRDVVGECVRLNAHWIEVAIRGQERRAENLSRMIRARRQGGVLNRMYAVQTSPAAHIRGHG